MAIGDQHAPDSPSTDYDAAQVLIEAYKAYKAPGNGNLCGLWALAAVIVHAENPNITEAKMFKFKEYLRYRDVEDLFRSPEYSSAVEGFDDEGIQAELEQTDFLSDRQLDLLLRLYCKKKGPRIRPLRLGIRSYPDRDTDFHDYIFTVDPSTGPVLWLINRYGAHWEALIPVIDPNDISYDGKAINLNDEAYAHDPRRTVIKRAIDHDKQAPYNNDTKNKTTTADPNSRFVRRRRPRRRGKAEWIQIPKNPYPNTTTSKDALRDPPRNVRVVKKELPQLARLRRLARPSPRTARFRIRLSSEELKALRRELVDD